MIATKSFTPGRGAASPFRGCCRWVLLVWIATLLPASLLAGTVEVEIRVKEAQARPAASQPGDQPATRVSLKAGETFEVRWSARNTDTEATFQSVLLHFFIEKERTAGAEGRPGSNAVYEGAMTMDFEPGEKMSWKFTTRLPEPGSYLLRVETLGLKGDGQTTHTDMILTVQ